MDAREHEREPAKPSIFLSDATLQIYVIPALVTVLIGVVLLPCFEFALLKYSMPVLYAATVCASFILALVSPILGTALHYVCDWTRRKIVALLTIRIPPFHLETSIVAIFVAAILLGGNLRPQNDEREPPPRYASFTERNFGIPFKAAVFKYPVTPANQNESLTHGKLEEISLLAIAANVVFAIGVIIGFAIWVEKIIRREDAAKAEARATRAFAQATAKLEH